MSFCVQIQQCNFLVQPKCQGVVKNKKTLSCLSGTQGTSLRFRPQFRDCGKPLSYFDTDVAYTIL